LQRTGELGAAAALAVVGSVPSASAGVEGPASPGARWGNPIGVSTYSFWQFRGKRLGIPACIDKAAEMGFDGVEILHVQMSVVTTTSLAARSPNQPQKQVPWRSGTEI
jgi:L-ribulose-5-phosphate 3-epimerase